MEICLRSTVWNKRILKQITFREDTKQLDTDKKIDMHEPSWKVGNSKICETKLLFSLTINKFLSYLVCNSLKNGFTLPCHQNLKIPNKTHLFSKMLNLHQAQIKNSINKLRLNMKETVFSLWQLKLMEAIWRWEKIRHHFSKIKESFKEK